MDQSQTMHYPQGYFPPLGYSSAKEPLPLGFPNGRREKNLMNHSPRQDKYSNSNYQRLQLIQWRITLKVILTIGINICFFIRNLLSLLNRVLVLFCTIQGQNAQNSTILENGPLWHKKETIFNPLLLKHKNKINFFLTGV